MLKRREERDTEKTSEKGSMVSRKKKTTLNFFPMFGTIPLYFKMYFLKLN